MTPTLADIQAAVGRHYRRKIRLLRIVALVCYVIAFIAVVLMLLLILGDGHPAPNR